MDMTNDAKKEKAEIVITNNMILTIVFSTFKHWNFITISKKGDFWFLKSPIYWFIP